MRNAECGVALLLAASTGEKELRQCRYLQFNFASHRIKDAVNKSNAKGI